MSKRSLRKILVFLADLVIFCCAVTFFWIFIPNAFDYTGYGWLHLGALYFCMLLFQVILRTYDSLWRYAAHLEYFMLLIGGVSGAILYEIIHYTTNIVQLNTAIVWGITSLATLGMLAMRFFYRMLRERRVSGNSSAEHAKTVAIVGAGIAGVLLLREFQNNPQSGFRPICFFDDEPEKMRRRVGGVPVLGTIEDLPKELKDGKVKHIFVAIPSLSNERMSQVLQICHQVQGVDIRVLPSTLLSMPDFEQKSLSKALRKVEIGDLLGRAQINLENSKVHESLENKVVLVTGGGGSIGSELCRQIARANPAKLVIIDIYENNAYDIQQELVCTYGAKLNLSVEIASIRDSVRMDEIFMRYRPQVVYHAAAHKHVPLMEGNPQEAVRNNVFGTYHVAMAAHRTGVERFVQISTDKAVNPTNVMGATKRMCELILQGIQESSDTEFVAVRFGNVLGSNGSVIPLFQRQIAQGGPVTITDKRITRYFMTIPEAVQLVLQAGMIANKNQVFVLDMGSPVCILDLAENLIRLSGYEPYTEMEIKEVGLRPGEKLYEELLVGGVVEKTENDLIFIEQQPEITAKEVEDKLSLLRLAMESRDDATVIQTLHQVVPTYQFPTGNEQDLETPVILEPQESLLQQRMVT